MKNDVIIKIFIFFMSFLISIHTILVSPSLSSSSSPSSSSMPLPFYREIRYTSPVMSGNDVLIAETLLSRDSSVSTEFIPSNKFDSNAETATKAFQKSIGISPTGVIDSVTAQKLLDLHSADNYKDDGFTAESKGYKYKFYLPVKENRSIETTGTLYDATNHVLITFPIRTHGYRDDGSHEEWPDFGDGDYGLNQFTSNGMTVTGLIEVDLNSPEPDPDLYGPWPVNRFVRGLDGNALLMLPNIRDGLLLHTGNWTTSEAVWTTDDSMPNSSGCIHSHPDSVQQIYTILTKIGVVVHTNPYSGKNYPYQPQGIAVIELVD